MRASARLDGFASGLSQPALGTFAKRYGGSLDLTVDGEVVKVSEASSLPWAPANQTLGTANCPWLWALTALQIHSKFALQDERKLASAFEETAGAEWNRLGVLQDLLRC